MSRGEINVDPIEGEFFSAEAIGGLSDALIREAIQNSMDAGVPGQQVQVVISFPSSDPLLPSAKSEPYLKDLKDHLLAKNSGLLEEVDLNTPMDFIVIEDFGTRGLEGDIREDEDRGSEEKKNDFFYFWRNIGRAVEGTTPRGRWGLGKTVFQAASRINSFFALTIRRGDPFRRLMGQSVLKIHRSGGRRFAPYGYFGHFEGDFALPLDDEAWVARFCQDFSIRRKDEPGLSVIVPFPEGEITPQGMLRAAMDQYFFPILAGDLVVTVVDGGRSQVLTQESIFPIVSSTDWPDKAALIRRLELGRWCIHLPDEEYERLKEPESNQAPYWDEALFHPGQGERLRRKLDEGKRMAIIAPLWVKRIGQDLQHSSYKIILERDDRLEKGEDHFIRDGVTISGISSLRQRGMRVIVSASDQPLSQFLGDSENPAHTEWQERSPKFKGRYDRGPSCLRYVKNSPREIVKILSRPVEGRDTKLLLDYFYVDFPEETEPQEIRPTAHPGPKPPPKDLIGEKILKLHRTKGGFNVFPHPGARSVPKEIILEVAYDVRHGNPFKRYKTFDFQLDRPPITLLASGVKTQILKPNVLSLILEKPNFRFTATGFDPNRDLKIKTLPSFDAEP